MLKLDFYSCLTELALVTSCNGSNFSVPERSLLEIVEFSVLNEEIKTCFPSISDGAAFSSHVWIDTETSILPILNLYALKSNLKSKY